MAIITGVLPAAIILSTNGPDDGDAPDAADVNSMVELLLDNDAYIKEHVDDIEANVYIVGNGPPTAAAYVPTVNPVWIAGTGLKLTSPITMPSTAFDNPVDTQMQSLGAASTDQCTITASNIGKQPLSGAPHGSSITHVKIGVDPVDDGLTPGTKVAVVLKRKLFSTGVVSTVDSFTDTSASEAYHVVDLDMSGAPHTVDLLLYFYFIEVQGETGGNANSVVWHGSRVEGTMTTMPFA